MRIALTALTPQGPQDLVVSGEDGAVVGEVAVAVREASGGPVRLAPVIALPAGPRPGNGLARGLATAQETLWLNGQAIDPRAPAAAVLRDGAILANAGHFDVEIDVRALAAMAVAVHTDVRPHADAYELPDGRRVLLLAEGRVVNLVAADGHPPEVMDLAFGIEALALARLAAGAEQRHIVAMGPVAAEAALDV